MVTNQRNTQILGATGDAQVVSACCTNTMTQVWIPSTHIKSKCGMDSYNPRAKGRQRQVGFQSLVASYFSQSSSLELNERPCLKT